MLKNIDRIGASLLLALGLNTAACDDDSTAQEQDVIRVDVTGLGGSTTSGGATLSTGGRPQPDMLTDTLPDTTPPPPVACPGSTPLVIDGQDTGLATCEGGGYHIPGPIACVNALPREPDTMRCPTDVGNIFCRSDTDCGEMMRYGHCEPSPFRGGCFCQDGCVDNADCPADSVCLCGDGIGVCVPSGCQSNRDCEGNALCLSYELDPGCALGSSALAFACQTPDDECLTRADCDVIDGDPQIAQYCAFDGTKRACQPITPCAIGRPFLVEGHARTAEVVARAEWSRDVTPSLEGLSAAQREALCDYWTDIGLMEHASVAAFARFAMQLMSVGAPPSLIEQTTAAMADETNHARLAFGLASALGQRPVGPGPLAVDDALGGESLEDILTLVIHEGCIGETVAAAEAAEARDHVSDPAIQAVLDTMIADETRHATLAWETVRWALSLGRDDVRRHITAVFATHLEDDREVPDGLSSTSQDALLAGIVDDELRDMLRYHALRRVVQPCLTQLLNESPPDAMAAS